MTLKSAVTDQPPLIFIHGSFANAGSWKKIIEKLNPKYECHTVNLPGHGGMEDPDDFNDPTLETEIEAVKSFVAESVNPQRGIHIVGHSYGCVVAMGIALTGILPVKKLTLFETVDVTVLQTFGKDEMFETVMKFVNSYEKSFEQNKSNACSMVIDFWGGPGSFSVIPEHIQQKMATMTENNIRHWNLIKNSRKEIEDYKNLDVPIAIVYGSKSNKVAKTISMTLHENLPKSSLHEIEGASHFMITSHATECAAIINNPGY